MELKTMQDPNLYQHMQKAEMIKTVNYFLKFFLRLGDQLARAGQYNIQIQNRVKGYKFSCNASHL